MKRHTRDVLVLAILAGILFTISWEKGWEAPTEIQYVTTPTSTWKRLVLAPAADNSFMSKADNNSLTRGRFYYFRARHILDNGYITPWSPKIGAIWLTGPHPDNTFEISKGDNTVITWSPK